MHMNSKSLYMMGIAWDITPIMLPSSKGPHATASLQVQPLPTRQTRRGKWTFSLVDPAVTCQTLP